jgi:hypothetical protein
MAMTNPTLLHLERALPVLLPAAIAWAEAVARDGLARGAPLDAGGIDLARRVGVQQPEQVRIVAVDSFPLPPDPELRRAALQTGLLGADGLGLTLGHAVFLRRGHETEVRLLRHEFRHVQQCERFGSLAAFLAEYLLQIVQVGYARAPLELDARAHETD